MEAERGAGSIRQREPVTARGAARRVFADRGNRRS